MESEGVPGDDKDDLIGQEREEAERRDGSRHCIWWCCCRHDANGKGVLERVDFPLASPPHHFPLPFKRNADGCDHKMWAHLDCMCAAMHPVT